MRHFCRLHMSLLSASRSYLSLVRFSHTIFAMPFALVGVALAYANSPHGFTLRLLLLVVICMVFARNAAMGFNRLIDSKIDANNPRTSNREIPKGIIKPRAALIFVIINCLLFIGTTAFINSLVLMLSPVALAVVLFYSYTKRFTAVCHFVLGLGLGLAPLGAYLAVCGHFAAEPLLLALLVMLWSAGFDIIYSLQDEAFDRSSRLHSIPAALGRKGALRISMLLHTAVALLVLVIALGFAHRWIYVVGATMFVGLLVYQHLIVSERDISRVNLAFGTTNGLASIAYAIFYIADILMSCTL